MCLEFVYVFFSLSVCWHSFFVSRVCLCVWTLSVCLDFVCVSGAGLRVCSINVCLECVCVSVFCLCV